MPLTITSCPPESMSCTHCIVDRRWGRFLYITIIKVSFCQNELSWIVSFYQIYVSWQKVDIKSTHNHQLSFTNNHASLCPLLSLHLFSTDSRPKWDKPTNEPCCLWKLFVFLLFKLLYQDNWQWAVRAAAAAASRLWKSSLRLPPIRAPYQTYLCQGNTIASPSCPGERWLYVGGIRYPKKNRASLGQEEAPAGRTCTPQGQPIASSTLTRSS